MIRLMDNNYYRTLKVQDPTNAFLVDYEEKSALFDTCAAQYTALIVE